MKINEKRLKLSTEEIEAARTPKGGFTREKLAEWGISWPPPHGWKKALVSGEEVEIVEPESHPDSIEAELLHEIVMALIDGGYGHVLAQIDNANRYYKCGLPTVADIVGGRSDNALIEGGLTWDDKVYRFFVMQRTA